MFKQYKLNEFNKELSSESATPGGGTVAALLGVLSSALTEMVINITKNKKTYSELRFEVKSILDSSLQGCESLNKDFQILMDKDSQAFNSVLEAFKLPKESANEKAYRSYKIQEGYKKALEVPMKTAREAYNLYDYILVASKYGNKNAISDVGVAALSIQAALEGAILNVKINAKSIKDSEYIARIEDECKMLTVNGREKRDEILSIVEEEING